MQPSKCAYAPVASGTKPIDPSPPTSQAASGRFAHIPSKPSRGGGGAVSTHQAPFIVPAQCVSGSPHADPPLVPAAPAPAAPVAPVWPAAPVLVGVAPAEPGAFADDIPAPPPVPWLPVVGAEPPPRPGALVPPSGAAEFELPHPH